MKLRKSANKMEDDLVEALGGFTADASCLQPRQQLFYGGGGYVQEWTSYCWYPNDEVNKNDISL